VQPIIAWKLASKINVALRAVIETIENSKTERGKEEREKEKSLVLFYFFLFFNWVRCIPLAPRRGGRGGGRGVSYKGPLSFPSK
jgi:hypothetical protein